MDHPDILQDQKKNDRDYDGKDKDGKNVSTLHFESAMRGQCKVKHRSAKGDEQWVENIGN